MFLFDGLVVYCPNARITKPPGYECPGGLGYEALVEKRVVEGALVTALVVSFSAKAIRRLWLALVGWLLDTFPFCGHFYGIVGGDDLFEVFDAVVCFGEIREPFNYAALFELPEG